MHKQGKHIPLRMCIGCRRMLPKQDLMRMVRDSQTGQIIIDRGQKVQSRGVYLCKDGQCIAQAQKKKALQRYFKGAVPDEIYERAARDWITY